MARRVVWPELETAVVLLLGCFAVFSQVSCGRVGLELSPVPHIEGPPGDDDASGDDAGANAEPDSGSLDAAESGAPVMEGPALNAGLCMSNPAAYVPDMGCGVGYCRLHNSPSSCENGAEIACVPAAPRTGSDPSCDGIDDDCDGTADEDYASAATNCGEGMCARSGTRTCAQGTARDSCAAGAPTASIDDATGAGNGLDDDCDGRVDEDIPGCDTTPRSFEAGNHANVPVPIGCGHATVRLWGAGGAGGADVGVLGSGGNGGAGGYSTLTVSTTGNISLLVGRGGADDCATEGTNPGAATYSGGSGGNGTGAAGADRLVSGGGAGGVPSSGRAGGRGHYGGGGGGQGSGGLGASGNGGGGGAASVFMMNGTLLAVAGGGGGGGGAQSISVLGTLAAPGGAGGSGCRGVGQVETGNGGGGGGGGMCLGTSPQEGSGTTPAFARNLPNGRARGGDGGCGSGGAGYAILTFSR